MNREKLLEFIETKEVNYDTLDVTDYNDEHIDKDELIELKRDYLFRRQWLNFYDFSSDTDYIRATYDDNFFKAVTNKAEEIFEAVMDIVGEEVKEQFIELLYDSVTSRLSFILDLKSGEKTVEQMRKEKQEMFVMMLHTYDVFEKYVSMIKYILNKKTTVINVMELVDFLQ